jgi:hypothetical protein
MYTLFSALDAAFVGRILRKRKEEHRKICGEWRAYSPHLRISASP